MSHSISRSGKISVLRLKHLPMGLTLVLSRLADSPELSLNPSMYLTQNRSELSVHSIVSVVSSAKVCALISPVPSGKPLFFLLFLILMRSISTTMMKMKGDIMSPWGTPCFRNILFVRCPPIRIIASLSLKNKDTHWIMSSPKFKFSRVLLMKL